LGRYGGEEFLIVLPDCDTARAAVRAEHIRKTVEAAPLVIPRGIAAVTISIGVSAGAASDLTELLAAADEHLYEAKSNGRNQMSSGRCNRKQAVSKHSPTRVLQQKRLFTHD
jgi:two-component system, cell cycle response regulator